jgi:hypothetical protein
MKSGANWLSRLVSRPSVLLAGCVAAAVVALAIGGCTTVLPVSVKPKQASWDQNQQNSGFIGFDQAGNGILTPHARDRYNLLILAYGKRFNPALGVDEGLTATATNTFLIDAQHLADFATMNRMLAHEPRALRAR